MDKAYKCRICNSNLFNKLVHLKEMPLTDDFVKVNESKVEFLQDIEIYQCSSCNLVQNPVDFDYQKYYQEYEYSSGHSDFTKKFMMDYAKKVTEIYANQDGDTPNSVVEIGSGDGEQLKMFDRIGFNNVLGIEPSKSLVRQSEKIGVPAIEGLFTKKTIDELNGVKFDICISSYTFDHITDPVEYLRTAYKILSKNGILAFEIHNIDDIYSRSEWCLFEHEHTIYMNKDTSTELLRKHGFEVISINPLDKESVRANSLIVIAKKSRSKQSSFKKELEYGIGHYSDIMERIEKTISLIEQWVDSIPDEEELIGWGVGGRGGMTLASLNNSDKFKVIFDSNYSSNQLLTPKTRIPICGKDSLSDYSDSWVLIFSFGYSKEITKELISSGFNEDKILSLDYFYNNVKD